MGADEPCSGGGGPSCCSSWVMGPGGPACACMPPGIAGIAPRGAVGTGPKLPVAAPARHTQDPRNSCQDQCCSCLDHPALASLCSSAAFLPASCVATEL